MKLAGLYRAVAEVFDGPLDIERHARKALLETADRQNLDYPSLSRLRQQYKMHMADAGD